MKKIFSLYPVIILAVIASVLYSSCKKPVHSNAPTPNNIRLMSYTATTRLSNVLPVAKADTTNQNYTFAYDGNNRVIQIIYTTNDLTVPLNRSTESITFYYGNDTVIKTTAYITGSPVFEVDTFIENSQGLITTTYTPGAVTVYDYYGKLLAAETESYYSGGTTISAMRIFNSDNSDFLNYSFNGTLNASFPNTLVTPLSVSWYTSLATVTHNPVNGYTDALTGYPGIPVVVVATDNSSNVVTDAYPGNIYGKQTYSFYTTMANRVGDYLQLGSFSTWGNNLYQNSHLVKSISNSGYNTNITYNIDAYSKVTQATAVIVDSLANTRTITYNLQYETY